MQPQEQVVELLSHDRDLVDRKFLQRFDRLELTHMAMPIPILVDRMKAAIGKHAAKGKIFQTRRSAFDPLIPVRVNTEKHVLIWDIPKPNIRKNIQAQKQAEVGKWYKLQSKAILQSLKNNWFNG
jgi:hypothetical protein